MLEFIALSLLTIAISSKLASKGAKYLANRQYSKFVIKRFFRNKNKDDCCVICQDDYHKNKKCVQLYCDHVFHKECIKDWFSQKLTCPLCNNHLITKKGDTIDNYYFHLPDN